MALIRHIIIPASAATLAASIGLSSPQDAGSSAPPEQTIPPARTSMQELNQFVDELIIELRETRRELAEVELENRNLRAELIELNQFIDDHDALGRDFEQYRAVLAVAEREAEQREIERRRAEYQRRMEEKKAERAAARQEATARKAVEERLKELNAAGFDHIGLDVFAGRSAFHYKAVDSTRSHIEYDPVLGHYPRIYRSSDIDFTEMTISGSIMNASNVVRNIGVAIVFFDDNGNQVGHETVQVNNARPDVPYPFTANVDMALNRPFSSSSIYVLYADPIAPPDQQ